MSKRERTQGIGIKDSNLPAIEVRDLVVEYTGGRQSTRVLESIDLQIKTGEFVCLLGPSGCGKSTLLRVLAGFLPAHRGQVLRWGQPPVVADHRFGVVFQEPHLYPWLNVFENVALGPKLRGLKGSELERLVHPVLKQVALWDNRFLRSYELSGGMAQRVALARALANEPDVILMDEPFGALDALTRRRMQDLLLEIWRKTRKTIFFITHSAEEAVFLATRILVMSGQPGRFVYERSAAFSTEIREASLHTVRSSRQFISLRDELLDVLLQSRSNAINRGAMGNGT